MSDALSRIKIIWLKVSGVKKIIYWQSEGANGHRATMLHDRYITFRATWNLPGCRKNMMGPLGERNFFTETSPTFIPDRLYHDDFIR